MELVSVARPQNVGIFIMLLLWMFSVGSNSTLSFSVETRKTAYMTGQYLTLQCLAKGNPSLIEIRRTSPKISLSKSQGGNLLKHTMPPATCAVMGIYECFVDREETVTTDIALADCGPCLCYGNEGIKTIFVDINKTAQFSFCVVAYMDIHFVKINGSLVTKNSTWRCDDRVKINYSPRDSNRFNITITRDPVVIGDYGLQVIRVFASSGILYFLDYYITLQHRGPSECPTNITAKGQGLDYILLSWIPGLDGGSSQNFHAYYSTDNGTWQKHETDIEDASVNITGLQANTTYYFKVISSNQYTADVNETVCDNTILVGTGDRSNEDMDQIMVVAQSDSKFLRLGVLVLTGVLLSFLVSFLVFMSWRLRRRQHNKAARNQDAQSDDRRPHTDQQLNPGEYISEEGLKYVTLAEVKKCRQGKAKARNKTRQDKTEYIVLDFSLTGKIHLQEEDTHAESIEMM